MTSDAQRVLALLKTLNDWVVGPTTWTKNPLCSREDSGEAPSTTRQCETCQGHGKRGKQACAPCNGTGHITVDAYTERAVSTSTQHVTRIRLVKCDSCAGHGAHGNGRRCWHCDGTGQRNAPDTEHTFEATARSVSTQTVWISDRKARQYASGSYAELEDALLRLQGADPNLHRYVLHHVVYGETYVATDSSSLLIAEACEWLAVWMPKPVKVPAHVHRSTSKPPKGNGAGKTLLGQRNEQVRAYRAAGLSLAKIGARMNLTKQRVSQILNEREAA